jgi:hypothetical protein
MSRSTAVVANHPIIEPRTTARYPMMESETLPSMASADRLSEVLRGCHMLRMARFRGCRRQLALDHPVAHFAVALDLCGGGFRCAHQEEAAFYKDVVATMQVERVPRCFEAEWEADTEPASSAIAWPLPPTAGNARRSSAQGRTFTRSDGTILDSGPSSGPGCRPITTISPICIRIVIISRAIVARPLPCRSR